MMRYYILLMLIFLLGTGCADDKINNPASNTESSAAINNEGSNTKHVNEIKFIQPHRIEKKNHAKKK
jgi:hypothetical protein